MSSFEIGKLAQVIHVTGELDAADAWYQDVFGGEQFYRGYSPYEMRDASLLAIGDFVIEPMAPAATEGADQMPVGRFFHRFGAHLHSIAVNVKGIPELCEHLQANDIRVVGPGGSDPKNQERDDVQSIYTHPKDTHCLIEFVDFGGEVMAQSPRLDPDWDADRWRTEHPLGFSGASHITVLVRDLERATGFFGGVLGSRVFHEAATNNRGCASRFLMLGNETVVEIAQPIDGDSRAGRDLTANGEIVHSITLRVAELAAATAYLTEKGVGLVARTDHTVVLDPADCFGAVIEITDALLPNDPRVC